VKKRKKDVIQKLSALVQNVFHWPHWLWGVRRSANFGPFGPFRCLVGSHCGVGTDGIGVSDPDYGKFTKPGN